MQKDKSRANASMKAWLRWQMEGVHHVNHVSNLPWDVKHHVIKMGYAHILKAMS